MLLSEIIRNLERIKEAVGDVKGYTTGYYDTNEVDEIKTSIIEDQEGNQETMVVFLPGNFP